MGRSPGRGSTPIAGRNEFSRDIELLVRQDWRSPVSAGKVATADRFLLTRIEVREGVQASGAIRALLGEPDLITANRPIAGRIAEDGGVVRVEHELGATRVGLRILEQADQLRNQGRVETGVEFVREQDGAVGKCFNDRADKAKPDKSAE